MFGNNDSWFMLPDDTFSSSNIPYSRRQCSSGYERPEVRRQRNEMITRDYFRKLYGEDPCMLGFEVPDWKWDW